MSDRNHSRELESLLVHAAREERAPSRTRLAVRAAVGLATGAGAATAAGSAAAAGAQTATGAVGIVVLAKYVILGAAIGATTLGVARYAEAPTPSATTASSAGVATEAPTARKAVDELAPAPDAAGTATDPVVVAPPPIETAATSSPTASAAQGTPSLAREIALLDQARSAVRAHDGAQALRSLDRYGKEFPSGQMAAEATLLRIDALVQTGDRATASALARAFIDRNPRSPLLERVQDLVPESNP